MAGRAVAARAQRALLWAGWMLLLLSLVTPDSRGHERGAHWLALAPVYGVQLLARGMQSPGQPGAAQSMLLGTALLLGAAANLTVLLRLGVAGSLAALALPWVPYLAYCDLWVTGSVPREASPGTLLYFYPWAFGIALIQASRLAGAATLRDLSAGPQPTRP